MCIRDRLRRHARSARDVEKPLASSYDVIIIGGGPAGMAAAIYTARQGLSTAIIAGEFGGQVNGASQIENYLGFGLIPGHELAQRFREHLSRFDIDTFPGQFVDALVPTGACFD